MWLWGQGGSHQLKVHNSIENPRKVSVIVTHCSLCSVKYSTASKRQPTSPRGVVHGGQGTRNEHCFSWHLLRAKHSVRCFVSFVFKGIVELGRYHDPRVTDENLGQRESWSPDLYWWVWKPTAPSVKAMEDKQNGLPTLWKWVKGVVLW